MEMELSFFIKSLEVVGGFQKRGYTIHDIDLNFEILSNLIPDLEFFEIIGEFGSTFYDEFGLDLDINLLFDGKRKYKFDKGGFFEYLEDGSLVAVACC
jgi:hypothetical protein